MPVTRAPKISSLHRSEKGRSHRPPYSVDWILARKCTTTKIHAGAAHIYNEFSESKWLSNTVVPTWRSKSVTLVEPSLKVGTTRKGATWEQEKVVYCQRWRATRKRHLPPPASRLQPGRAHPNAGPTALLKRLAPRAPPLAACRPDYCPSRRRRARPPPSPDVLLSLRNTSPGTLHSILTPTPVRPARRPAPLSC
ncbi:uncharacterized protein LOC144578150 isoform X2 [Callithrix jacchus]